MIYFVLGERFGRHISSVADQLLLPALLKLDGIELLHSLANDPNWKIRSQSARGMR